MHFIRIHKVIGLIISSFYLIGFWHRGDKPTLKETRWKLFHCIHYTLFVLATSVGAINSEKRGESIFLGEISIGAAVMAVKIWILTWNQNQIVNLLNRVCVFSIRNDDVHKRFESKLRGFMTFVLVLLIASVLAAFFASIVLSLVGSEKSLFLKIGFPLNYQDSEIAFWMATVFIFTELHMSVILVSFTVVIWYLLFVCALRYEMLGNELKNMGRTIDEGDGKKMDEQIHKTFYEDLVSSIGSHLHLRECASLCYILQT